MSTGEGTTDFELPHSIALHERFQFSYQNLNWALLRSLVRERRRIVLGFKTAEQTLR